jgi:nucleotide-binding universal stress UspA family protein
MGFQRVVAAIDGTSQTADVLAVAARAAGWQSGQVRLVHVRPWQPVPPPSREDGSLVAADVDLFTETAAHAKALVDGAVRDIGSRGARADAIVVEAQQPTVGFAVVNAAEAWGADLIVVGRRQRRLLGSLLRRGVSDQVLQQARCPVLLVPVTSAR